MINSSKQIYAKNNMPSSNTSQPSNMESQDMIHQIEKNESHNSTQNYAKPGLNTKAKAIIFLIIALAIIAAIVIPIAIVLNNKSNDSQQVTYDLCTQDPSQCQGLTDGIRSFINQNFANRDQAMSAVQAARSLSSISPESTQEEQVENYQNVRRSLECMSQTMTPQKQEQTYADLQDLTLDTDQKTDAYLDMNGQAGGTPIISLTDQQAAASCNFEGSSKSRVRNLQLAHQARVLSNQVGAEAAGSTCAVYVYQYGLSPYKLLLHLRQWKSALATRNIFRFVAIGIKRRSTTSRFLSEITRRFFSTINGSITGRMRRQWKRGYFDFSHRNRMSVSSAEDQNIFLHFYRFIKVRILQYSQQPSHEQDYSIALNYIRLQISLGMKLVILSHSGSSQYSNKIYNQLSVQHKQSCSQLFVSPGSSSIQSGEYITSQSDTYIIYLRLNGFTPLQNNIHAVTFDSGQDMGDHHELSGYLQKCKQKIVQKFTNVENKIVSGKITAVDGPIVVQLTWDTAVDIDLSIVQPDQTIVYYGSPNGKVGILSTYDKKEISEEFYYVPEGQVVVGDYAVRVFYKKGSVTTKVRFIISGGVSYYVNEFDLYPSSPVITIVIIRVTQNPNTGVFSYNLVKSTTPIDQGECDNVTKSINVDLSWQDTSADLDLHIIEPSSYKVSVYNLIGDVGSLSEYVQHGGGNGQIYQTVCDNFTVGQYVIGVNYYSGQSKEPITGSIKMKAGSNEFQQNITLVAPVGEAGIGALFSYVGIIYVEIVNQTFSYTFVPWAPECEDSSFKVYVSWDKYSDLDLFVTEPSGFRVDFNTMEGPVGGLMNDPFLIFGPEIYQTKCGELVEGDYVIRLNYFQGFEPTVATVIIRMGTEYVVNLIRLKKAIGEDGVENPPHKVGIIRVTKDGDVFVFSIAEQIEKECPTESLQVTLTWEGVSQDLDLHILEPSGFHVKSYYATGTHGYLSEDIHSGGGSGETYQTACTNIVGQYFFGINYFSGEGNVTGIITIIISNQTETVQIPLIAPVGLSGENFIPYIVGKVTVQQDNGTLSYTFVPWAHQCLDSSINVYVSWDKYSDLDLFVTEPSGFRVDFNTMEGPVGGLINNPFLAFGPEVYQTRCGELVEGDYVMRLNYYQGFEPTVATVIVRMGTEYVVNYLKLDEAIGEDGVENPPHEAGIIRVTKDGDAFTFSIV